MKKITVLICLLLTLTLCAGALADSGNAMLFTTDQKTQLGLDSNYCSSMAAVGDTVYTLWNTFVCTWQAGQAAPQVVASGLTPDYYSTYDEAKNQAGDQAETLIYKLVSDGTTLYGLNRHTGKLFPLTFADGKMVEGAPVTLDWTGIETTGSDDSSYRDIVRVVISGGKLYLLMRDYQNYDQPILYAFDMASGQQQLLNVPNLQDIYPYRDGKMLAYLFDRNNAYADDGTLKTKPVLAVVDPADGSATPVVTLDNPNIFGLVYQPTTDILYYVYNDQLMAMQAFGQPTVAAYVPSDYTDTADAALLSSGLYALNTWNGLIVRNTDPQYIPTSTLAVYGGSVDETATTFIAQNPQIALTFNQNVYYSTAEQLAQSMTSGDSTFDVFNIDLSYQDFQSLLDKGYCMDLSGSQALSDKLSKVYPFVQTALQKDGKFYAVPTSMSAYGLSIQPTVWKDAGIEDKIPTSYMGLIDFLNWWLDEGENAHPDLQLMDDNVSDYRQTLFQLAFNMYVSDCQANGQALSLNTPVFQAMLSALDSLDTDALNETLPSTQNDDETKATMMAMDSSNVLFTNYGDWLRIYGSDSSEQPLILSLQDGGEQHVPVELGAVFINPNTKNPDAALSYLECIMEHMDPAQHIMMFPDDNTPVPVENFDKNVASWQTELEKQETLLKTAKPEDVKDIQSMIDSYNDLLKNQDKYRWQVSKESIEQFRSVAPLCFAQLPNLLSYNANNGDSDISTLIDRYLQKQIPLDQFLQQADQKIHMIQMERQ